MAALRAPGESQPAMERAKPENARVGAERLKRTTSFASVILALGCAATGCAGAQTDITAKESRYPISLSGVLVDEKGIPVYLGHELEEVGILSDKATTVGFFYASTGIDHDLSEAVNAQVEAAHGEGVVNLAVTSKQCALNYMWPLTILPIWPGCLSNSVTGVIVRRKRAPSGLAAEAIAGAPQPTAPAARGEKP